MTDFLEAGVAPCSTNDYVWFENCSNLQCDGCSHFGMAWCARRYRCFHDIGSLLLQNSACIRCDYYYDAPQFRFFWSHFIAGRSTYSVAKERGSIILKLRLHHVNKSFQTKKVLEDISFEVKEGEFVSLIGPSGSGKSTLFALIGGIIAPDDGDILMEEKSIVNQTGFISYMPQQDALFPWRTILKNVLLGQELYGKADTERAKEMLQKAGLADVMYAYPHELSGGMRQRASFIRALLSPQH